MIQVFSREPTPTPRLISVGAFFDRFKPYKLNILADQTPLVKAVILDASVRDFIDLDNPDLPGGIQVLKAAGHAVDEDFIINGAIQYNEIP